MWREISFTSWRGFLSPAQHATTEIDRGQSCAVFSTGPIVFLDSLKEKQIWHEQKALEIFLKV